MNFKTTLFLLILLAGAGIAVFFVNESPRRDETDQTTATPTKLLSITSSDATQLVITPADGKRIVLKRDGMQWNLLEPVAAPAEANPPSEILSDLEAMTSTGHVADAGADSAATGLTPPQFSLEIDTKDGKSTKLNIGNRSGTGDQLYVQLEGTTGYDLVQANIYDLLDKPVTDFRRKKLLDVETAQVQHVEVNRPEGNLVLQKFGEHWIIQKPAITPGDNSAITDLIMGLSSLQAYDFVSDTDPNPRKYGLDDPTLQVSYSTTPASTQPTTAPDQGMTTVKFGLLDVRKQYVYVSTSGSTAVARVPVSSMDAFKKNLLDLRDKEVLNVDPTAVSGIKIQTILPATTKQTTRQASETIIALDRRPVAATNPTTSPTTQAATAPVKHSVWEVISTQPPADAADAKVDALLSALHPLRVTQYDAAPTTQPATADRYTVTVSCPPPLISTYKIDLTDPGDSRPLVGRYNDLTFELDRSLLDKIKTDFTHADETNPAPSASPSFSPAGPSGP